MHFRTGDCIIIPQRPDIELNISKHWYNSFGTASVLSHAVRQWYAGSQTWALTMLVFVQVHELKWLGWLWNQGQIAPEVQNKGTRVPIKK